MNSGASCHIYDTPYLICLLIPKRYACKQYSTAEFQPATKSSKANAPAKPGGLAAAARGKGRAAASRAKDSIAAKAIDEDAPEETVAATTEKAVEDKVRLLMLICDVQWCQLSHL